MHNTNLIQLLKSFTAYEMNSLEKFVISPFFNSNKKIISFFRILKKNYPDFDAPAIDKEKIFKKIYPRQKYADKKMRYLTYELLNLTQEFLGISEYLKGDVINPANNILTGLGEKKAEAIFEKKMYSSEKEIDIAELSNTSYFYNKWSLDNLKIRYKYFLYGKSMDPDILINSGEEMVLFSIISLSYIFFNISITSHAVNTRQDSFIINDFMESIDLDSIVSKAKKFNHPYAEVIEIYYCIIMMIIREEDESYFFRLNEIMKAIPAYLVREDSFNIYANLSAYCGKQIVKGKNKFVRESFEIYKTQLLDDIYAYKDGLGLNTVTYHNIIQLGLYLKEFDWVEKFIVDYTCKIISNEQENMLNFGYACLNFEKGNYNDIFQYASKIKPDHFFLKYEIRQITLRTHYELNQVEQVLSLIDSSKHFLNKNKSVSDERRIPFSNFLKFLSEIIKMKIQAEDSALETLEKEITAESTVIRKTWLLQKVNEIKKVNK